MPSKYVANSTADNVLGPVETPKRRRLSLHEELFCRAYLAHGGSVTEACKQIYPDTKQPYNRGNRLVKRLRWRIRELVDRTVGQLDHASTDLLQEVGSIAFRDDGTVSHADRLRALELLARLKGLDKPDKSTHAPSVAVQINLAGTPSDTHVDATTDEVSVGHEFTEDT